MDRRELIERATALIVKHLDDATLGHSIRVAESVERWTDDAVPIAAAILHDFLEDGPPNAYELLKATMPGPVIGLVLELTDAFTPEARPYQNRAIRKGLEARRLGGCSPAARLIKLADVLDNSGRIEEKGGEFAKLWLNERETLVWALIQ